MPHLLNVSVTQDFQKQTSGRRQRFKHLPLQSPHVSPLTAATIFSAFLPIIYKMIAESLEKTRRWKVYVGFSLVFIFNMEALK